MSGQVSGTHCNIVFDLKSKTVKVYSIVKRVKLLLIFSLYSHRTSIARTLMAHSTGLARTIIIVPTDHFMHNPPWITETSLG